MKPVTVVIADDQPVLRDALADFIRLFDDFHLLGAAASGQEALELVSALGPDIALIDMRMPGGGVELVGEIRARAPGTRVLVLSAAGEPEIVMQALRSGASGYLVKGDLPQTVIDALRAVARGQRPVSEALADHSLRWLLARMPMSGS
jgi:DNA-binding NarL/FixJ family response regulator